MIFNAFLSYMRAVSVLEGAALESGLMDQAQWLEYAAADNGIASGLGNSGDTAQTRLLEDSWSPQVRGDCILRSNLRGALVCVSEERPANNESDSSCSFCVSPSIILEKPVH